MTSAELSGRRRWHHAEPFCPHCDVAINLHDIDNIDNVEPSDCRNAERKAALIDSTWSMKGPA